MPCKRLAWKASGIISANVGCNLAWCAFNSSEQLVKTCKRGETSGHSLTFSTKAVTRCYLFAA